MKFQKGECAISSLIAGLTTFFLVCFRLKPGFRIGDETLLVYDHLDLIANGASVFSLNFARIPSIFPDYLLAGLSKLAGSDYLQQYFAFMLMQCGLQLVLCVVIVKLLCGKQSWVLCTSVVSSIYVTLDFLSSDFARNIKYSYVPINHGGNSTLVLLGIALVLWAGPKTSLVRDLRDVFSVKIFCAIVVLIFIATVSNRIFVIQFSLPLLTILVLPLAGMGNNVSPKDFIGCFRLKQESLVLVKIVFCATCLGLLSSKWLLASGCIPPIDFRPFWDQGEIAKFRQTGFLFLVGIASAIGVWRLRDRSTGESYFFDRTSLFIFFIGLSSIFSLCLNSFIAFQASEQRYILPLYFYAILLISVMFLRYLPHKARLLKLIGFVGLVGFPAVIIGFSLNSYESYASFVNFVPADLEFILEYVPASANVAVFVPDSVTESRVLKLASSKTIHFSRFASNGKPDSWDQGRSEFRMLGEPGAPIRNYRFWYHSGILLDSKSAIPYHFGRPNRVIINPKTGSQIWAYDDLQGPLIDKEIIEALDGNFRVDCL